MMFRFACGPGSISVQIFLLFGLGRFADCHFLLSVPAFNFFASFGSFYSPEISFESSPRKDFCPGPSESKVELCRVLTYDSFLSPFRAFFFLLPFMWIKFKWILEISLPSEKRSIIRPRSFLSVTSSDL